MGARFNTNTEIPRPRIVNPHVALEQYKCDEVFDWERGRSDFWLRLAVAYIGNEPLNRSSLDAEGHDICAKVFYEPIDPGEPLRIRYAAWFAFDAPFIGFAISEEHRLIVAAQDTRDNGQVFAVYYERLHNGPYEKRVKPLVGERFRVTASISGLAVAETVFVWDLQAKKGQPISIVRAS